MQRREAQDPDQPSDPWQGYASMDVSPGEAVSVSHQSRVYGTILQSTLVIAIWMRHTDLWL